MLHALNPYGFSHLRRVNEDNADLNRNFVDFSRAAAGPSRLRGDPFHAAACDLAATG